MTFQPPKPNISRISQGHSLHQVWTLRDLSFLSYAPDKQTNKQTNKHTDRRSRTSYPRCRTVSNNNVHVPTNWPASCFIYNYYQQTVNKIVTLRRWNSATCCCTDAWCTPCSDRTPSTQSGWTPRTSRTLPTNSLQRIIVSNSIVMQQRLVLLRAVRFSSLGGTLWNYGYRK